jgi:hypothetical protein
MLPFTYTSDKSIEVKEFTSQFLKENVLLFEEIMRLSWVYHSIHNVIPTTWDSIWSGHNFPYNESLEELQISYSLLEFGLYKQAMASLRSVLELGLLSVYYNLNDLGHITVKGWIESKEDSEYNTPRSSIVWKILLQHPNIKEFQDQIDIKQRVLDLGYLHNYVHTKGLKFSNRIGLFKGNSQSFEKKGLDSWFVAFKEIVTIVTTLHLLKYPTALLQYDYEKKFGIDAPSFSHLRPFEIENIRALFPPEFVSKMIEISEKSQETIDFLNWLDSHQDMTDDELEEQILNMDKFHIDGPGYKNHLNNELVLYGASTFEDLPDHIQKKLVKLEKWANDNNCYNPKFDIHSK